MTRNNILKIGKGSPIIRLTGERLHPQIVLLSVDPWLIGYDDLGLYFPATEEGVEEWKEKQTDENDRNAKLPEYDWLHISEAEREAKQRWINDVAEDLLRCIKAIPLDV